MATYGYCRVSDAAQNEDRQLMAMSKQKIPAQNIFTDKQSGKNFDRPEYKALVDKLRHGDLLYVQSIDRLGRNYGEIQNQWRILTKESGVDIVVIDMPLLDTRKDKDLLGTFIADLTLQILSFISEHERETIRKRQAEGIAAAKKRGVRFGRPFKPVPKNFTTLIKKWKRGEMTFDTALQKSGLKRATFYNRLKELQAVQQPVHY
jgi:DNA invertase Pin-like site-specific DNA recombinase